MNSKFLLLLIVMLTSSCASTSRMVKETRDGGRVMILGSRGVGLDAGIKHANGSMSKKCPKGFDITEKGWMQSSSITGKGTVEEKYFDFKCK